MTTVSVLTRNSGGRRRYCHATFSSRLLLLLCSAGWVGSAGFKLPTHASSAGRSPSAVDGSTGRHRPKRHSSNHLKSGFRLSESRQQSRGRLQVSSSVEELLAKDGSPTTVVVETYLAEGKDCVEGAGSGQAAFPAEGRDSGAGNDPVSGSEREERDQSVLRQLSALATVAGLAAVLFDYEHGMAGFHWFQHWAGGDVLHTPARSAGDGFVSGVHLTPLRSLVTGLGAGFTRAASRTVTFPLDTLKTRRQVSKLRPEDRAALPEEMRRLMDRPASFKGVFNGFSAFLAQAGPSNAIFFLVYDALNALGAAALLSAGVGGGFYPTALHLGASSLATVPSNLVRTPAEVVKQRLQVGRQTGNSLEAFLSILEEEGVGGLFVGGREQLIREIPFNAIQFAVYECLKANMGSSELWADAALGAASSAVAAVSTQPVDTVKTRVMTKSVPGVFNGECPGFVRAAALVAEAEGTASLFLGLLPRLVLVSTGGAFYFWGQEFASMLLSQAGF